MFKPLIERIRTGFGAVSAPAAPMPNASSDDTLRITEAPAGIRETSGPESMMSLVLSRLVDLEPDDLALRERLEKLKTEIGPLLMQADELESTILTNLRESLEAEHRQIRKQGRKQHELVALLAQELQQAELNLRNAAAHQEAVLIDARVLSDREREGKHVPRWASDEEIEAWDQRVTRAKARIDPANQACVEALQIRNQAQATLDEAQRELARLGSEDTRLRKQLAGEPYTDPEYGLEVPSR